MNHFRLTPLLLSSLFCFGCAFSQAQPKGAATLSSFEQEMVPVAKGVFTMGCTSEQTNCKNDEKPAHSVQVDSFRIGKYEVTQAQWQLVMGNNPSHFSNCAQCPVEQVSYIEIQNFLSKLNALTGKRFRLPSEAEWEYAARGGQNTQGFEYSGSHQPVNVAWFGANGNNQSHPVGQKEPNELGLYDMSGNVWEWCNDWYSDTYYVHRVGDTPHGPRTGENRVIRGGAWYGTVRNCRLSNRRSARPDFCDYHFGFRLAEGL